jgi:hypothetical protein
MRIAIASDHAAIELKSVLVAHLQAAGHEVSDLGPFDTRSTIPIMATNSPMLLPAALPNAALRCADRGSAFRSRSTATRRVAPRWFPNPFPQSCRANIMTPT